MGNCKVHEDNEPTGRSLGNVKVHEDNEPTGRSLGNVKVHEDNEPTGRSLGNAKVHEDNEPSFFARIERGQGADLRKGHFCARPIILRALLRVILHFEGTMGK